MSLMPAQRDTSCFPGKRLQSVGSEGQEPHLSHPPTTGKCCQYPVITQGLICVAGASAWPDPFTASSATPPLMGSGSLQEAFSLPAPRWLPLPPERSGSCCLQVPSTCSVARTPRHTILTHTSVIALGHRGTCPHAKHMLTYIYAVTNCLICTPTASTCTGALPGWAGLGLIHRLHPDSPLCHLRCHKDR